MKFFRRRKTHDIQSESNVDDIVPFYAKRVLNENDFSCLTNSSDVEINSFESYDKLRDEFNICVRNWSLYMFDMTRTKSEKYALKKLQMVLNINSFGFNPESNKFNGRVTVVLNEKQDNNEHKLIKTFNAEMEQIFQEGLKKRWIEENSMWIVLFSIDKESQI